MAAEEKWKRKGLLIIFIITPDRDGAFPRRFHPKFEIINLADGARAIRWGELSSNSEAH